MIIGVDAGCFGVSDIRLKTGVYHFGFNLLKQLSSIDKKNKYLLYSFFPMSKDTLSEFRDNVQNRVIKPKIGWLNLRLSLEFLFKKPDIFLGLSQALPIYHPLKTIIVVYDLAFERYPECYGKSYHRLSRQTKYAVKNCDKIIAVSDSTKNDIVNLYGIDPDKITVIYHGIPIINRFADFTPQGSPRSAGSPLGCLRHHKEIIRIKKKYHLKDNYFLFVGSLKPIKNIPRLIQAFAIFLGKVKKDYQLVLAGSDYWLDKNISEKIDQLKLKKSIKILGYVADEDLPGLYRNSLSFVSPSLYEGFGIPIIEAMACKTPVITSNTSSMPEITGKSAILVNPENIKDLSGALYQIATDENLRKKLKKEGPKRAGNFSWKKSAKQLLYLIESI